MAYFMQENENTFPFMTDFVLNSIGLCGGDSTRLHFIGYMWESSSKWALNAYFCLINSMIAGY